MVLGFYLGALDDEVEGELTADDAITFGYSLGIGLNFTSFTGEDSLDITIDAGNVTEGVAELDGNTTGDQLLLMVLLTLSQLMQLSLLVTLLTEVLSQQPVLTADHLQC